MTFPLRSTRPLVSAVQGGSSCSPACLNRNIICIITYSMCKNVFSTVTCCIPLKGFGKNEPWHCIAFQQILSLTWMIAINWSFIHNGLA